MPGPRGRTEVSGWNGSGGQRGGWGRDASSLCTPCLGHSWRGEADDKKSPLQPAHGTPSLAKTLAPRRGWAPRAAAAALGADVPGEPVHKELNPASPDCEFSASLPHAAKQQLDIFHPSRERQRREDIPMIPFCMPNYELRCSSICPGPASST